MKLLKNPTFLKMWLANLAASFGGIFYEVVIVWYLVTATGSALVAAGIPLAVLIGRLIASLLISQKVDSWSTKGVMITAIFMRCLLLVTVLLFADFLTSHLMLIFTISFVLAIFDCAYDIARRKSIPELVTPEELVSANGLEGVSASIVRIFAWGLGGAVITWLNLGSAITIALSAFGIALIFLILSQWTSIKTAPNSEWSLAGFPQGVKMIKRNDVIKTLVRSKIVFYLMMGFMWVAFPMKVATLGDGMLYGLQGMAFGIGYLLTSILVSRKATNRVGNLYFWGFAIYMVGNVFMSFAWKPWILLAGLFISGLGTSYWMTGQSTLIHLEIPTENVGKVFSVYEVFTSLTMIPGYVLGGLLVDILSPGLVMGVMAVLQFVALVMVRGIQSRR